MKDLGGTNKCHRGGTSAKMLRNAQNDIGQNRILFFW